MRKAFWTVWAGPAMLALTACATTSSSTNGTRHNIHPLRPVDVPTVPYVEGANAESVNGSLTWEDGCLLFRSDAGEHLLPVWPRASVFNGTSLLFHRPGKAEQPLLINQQVDLGGERLPLAYAGASFPDYLQRCGGVPFFVADVAPAN